MMQMQHFLALVVACLVVSGQASSPDEADTSVSSAIADTMAAIVGRAHARAEPPRAPVALARTRQQLSRVRNQEVHQVSAKKMVSPRADAPKQLSGYLGWSNKAKAGFSTKWATTGEKAAKGLSASDIAAPAENKPVQQALVASTVTTAFSKKLDDDMSTAEFDLNLDWGAKAKTETAKKAETVKIAGSNSYLDAVGWKSSAPVIAQKENPYLDSFHDNSGTKKFLAAAEVATTQDKHKYFDDLMPSAEDELSMQ